MGTRCAKALIETVAYEGGKSLQEAEACIDGVLESHRY